MNRLLILSAITAIGIVLWVIQARKIDELEAELDRAKQPASTLAPRAAAGGGIDRPVPTRSRQTAARIASPERRDVPPEPESPRAAAPVVAHLANELADQMRLDAGQKQRVLPLLERHIRSRQKASAALLESGSNLLLDTTDMDENVLSNIVDHAGFHAAIRDLNANSTREIDPLLDNRAREILHADDAAHRANTVRLMADNDYITWKGMFGFAGVEQEAYDVFRDLSDFRIANPLPEGFTREELATRLADERRFLSESLSAVLGEEKGQSIRQAIEALAPAEKEGDAR